MGNCFDRQERHCSSILPAWSRWIARGRIGFMSTQRREDRNSSATTIRRRGFWSRLWLATCKDRVCSLGSTTPTPPARNLHAIATGRTAPPVMLPTSEATNSLPSDYQSQQPARLLRLYSPPPGKAIARRPLLERPRVYPPTPLSAVSAFLHPALPRVPAALCRRTERYDGKRDLHFKHAA
jgi:hypothetical protein